MSATHATATRSAWPLAGAQIHNARPHPSWAEWSAAQAQRSMRRKQSGDPPFSDRELARLAFLRWLYQTGGSLPSAPLPNEGR